MKVPKLTLIILDGVGISSKSKYNAVLASRPKVLDRMYQRLEIGKIKTHGTAVGLPKGVMGNSEVGHANIGAGRIVKQDLVRINNAIKNGEFAKNHVLNDLFDYCVQHCKPLHVIGLISDGRVHSSIEHLFALIRISKQAKIPALYIHAILDGRDTPPTSGADYLEKLQDVINKEGFGEITSVIGRYFAMDRDNRWERVERAYRLWTNGCQYQFENAVEMVNRRYQLGETDEFMSPIFCSNSNHVISPENAIFAINFRADRMRQISQALAEPEFYKFERPKFLKPKYATMTKYQDEFPFPVLFERLLVIKTIGEILSNSGKKQLRIAETEKYAHVTYFMNNGREQPFPGEERIMVPSPKVATYDLQPEMSAIKVKDYLISAIRKDIFSYITVNFANGDMVGHTGNFDAAKKAMETIDHCLQEILAAQIESSRWTIITADHGNCEQMRDEYNDIPHTQHTLNVVPLLIFDDKGKPVHVRDGKLSDIAPTILKIYGISKPESMTGESLI